MAVTGAGGGGAGTVSQAACVSQAGKCGLWLVRSGKRGKVQLLLLAASGVVMITRVL